MTIRQYVDAVRNRWQIVAAAATAGLLCAIVFLLVRTPEYTASALVYVSSQATDSASLAYQGGLLSEQRVKSYTDLISSSRVAEDVIRDLRLTESPPQLSAQLSAANAANSTLISISATDPSPQRAADLANSTSRAFTNLVNELERPATPNGVQPISIRTVQPAATPSVSSSISALAILAAGLLVGLFVGFAAAVIARVFDTRIRDTGQLATCVSAPPMGVVPEIRSQGGLEYDNLVEPRPEIAESLRKVRTNLQYIAVDDPVKTVLITSPMPNEGKTSLVCGLANIISAAGNRVVLLDCDLRNPSIAKALGLDDSIGVTTIVAGRLPFDRAIQRVGTLDVITAGPLPPNPSELLSSRAMLALLNDLASRYEFVLVDSPPLIPVTDAAALAAHVDGVLLLSKYKKTTESQAKDARSALEVVSARVLGCLLTMTPPMKRSSYGAYYGQKASVGGTSEAKRRPAPSPVPHSSPDGTQPVPFVRER